MVGTEKKARSAVLLVLCALEDTEALSFVRYARAAGVRCEVLTGEAFSFAGRRSHRLFTSGGAGAAGLSSVIQVPGMPALTDSGIDGVLNRLTASPSAAWSYAAAAEQNYALAELHAFVLSWLTSLPCPVRNRPTGESLSGPVIHPLVLLGAAHQAGLDAPAVRLPWEPAGGPGHRPASTDAAAAVRSAAVRAVGESARTGNQPSRTVDEPARSVSAMFLDGAPLDDRLPTDIASRTGRMLDMLDLTRALVGVEYRVRADRWVYAGLTTRPPLRAADDTVYRGLLNVLTAGADRAGLAGVS